MADIIEFPTSGSKEPRESASTLAGSIGLEDGAAAGHSADVIDAAGGRYGQLALDEFEGDAVSALASLDSAMEFILDQQLVARAERMLGPRGTPPEAA